MHSTAAYQNPSAVKLKQQQTFNSANSPPAANNDCLHGAHCKESVSTPVISKAHNVSLEAVTTKLL